MRGNLGIVLLKKFIRENSAPLKAFFISRFGLFILVYLTLVIIPVQKNSKFWRAYPDNPFLDGWARFDTGWYARIAEFGYKNTPTGNGQDTNFFPMYPLVVKAVNSLVGNIYLSGIIVANICFFLALLGLYRLIYRQHGPRIAARTVYILAFNPFSFFFSAMYSEAMFLFFAVFAFFFCERRHYLLAGLFAAGAGATRNVGIFTGAGLGLIALRQADYNWRQLEKKGLWLLLCLSGPVIYIVFLTIKYNDALLFIHAQHAWGSFNPAGILKYTFKTLHQGSFLSWGYPTLFLFYTALGVAAILIVLITRCFLGLPYVVFSLLLIFPAFLRFTGMGRYLIVVFPLFIALAGFTVRKRVYWAFLSVETGLLVLFSFMFSHWHWVA